jgi:hypothetical protein
MNTLDSETATAPETGDSPRRLVPVIINKVVDQEQDKIVTGKLRAGDLCPQCKQGRLDYDGLLNLSCTQCGYAVGGCFT